MRPALRVQAHTSTRQQALQDVQAQWAPLAHARAQASWALATTGDAAHATAVAEATDAIDTLFRDEALAAQVRSPEALDAPPTTTDAYAERVAELIERQFSMRSGDPALLADIASRSAELFREASTFRGQIDGAETSTRDVEKILAASDDDDLRRKAWEAAMSLGGALRDDIVALVERRNELAVSLGHRDFFAMSLDQQELSEEKLFATLAKLEKATRGPYRTRKAVVDGELAERFGVETLAPWHYADPNFQRAAGDGDGRLDGYYADVDLVAAAVRFFDGIGWNIRDVLERSDLEPRDGKNPHAFCTHLDRAGDIRILCNLHPSARWMGTLLHELGHAAYERYFDDDLPWVLRRPPHALTTEAIAMLMGRQASEPEFLIEYADVPAFEITPLSGELRRHQCFSMQVFVRWALVMIHFEKALYADPSRDDLDAHWWELKRKYQLIEPPDGRDAPDWAAKIHFAVAPVYYQSYVLGEVLASQLRQTITRASRAGSIVDSQHAGELLIDRVFRAGASMRWDALVEHATGEPLDPSHFIREFTT